MGWDIKAVLFVIIIGIALVIVVGLVKVGELLVRRRTKALLAAHADVENGTSESENGSP